MPLSGFHPLVARWFSDTLGTPTPAQVRGWEGIRQGRHTLIAAPTGSGKTLAAFLTAIDDLVCEAVSAPLPDEVRVLYVSPLKALSADIHKNLAEPRARYRSAGAGVRPRAAAHHRCRAHRRHHRRRTRRHAAHAAAHPGDDARVAVSAADIGTRPADAAHRPHGHRRRNPRRHRHAPRRTPRALARTAAAARRSSAAPARPLGDAEAGGRGRRYLVASTPIVCEHGDGPECRDCSAGAGPPSSTRAIAARSISRSSCRVRRSTR